MARNGLASFRAALWKNYYIFSTSLTALFVTWILFPAVLIWISYRLASSGSDYSKFLWTNPSLWTTIRARNLPVSSSFFNYPQQNVVVDALNSTAASQSVFSKMVTLASSVVSPSTDVHPTMLIASIYLTASSFFNKIAASPRQWLSVSQDEFDLSVQNHLTSLSTNRVSATNIFPDDGSRNEPVCTGPNDHNRIGVTPRGHPLWQELTKLVPFQNCFVEFDTWEKLKAQIDASSNPAAGFNRTERYWAGIELSSAPSISEPKTHVAARFGELFGQHEVSIDDASSDNTSVNALPTRTYQYTIHSSEAPMRSSLYDINNPDDLSSSISMPLTRLHSLMHMAIYRLNGYWENYSLEDMSKASVGLTGMPVYGHYMPLNTILKIVGMVNFILIAIWLFVISNSIVVRVVTEKELFIDATLRIFGARALDLQNSWLASFFIVTFPCTFIWSLIFGVFKWSTIHALPHIFLSFVLATTAMLTFGVFLAAPFSSKKSAQIVSVVALLAGFIPTFFSEKIFPYGIYLTIRMFSPFIHVMNIVLQFQFRSGLRIPISGYFERYRGYEGLGVSWLALLGQTIVYYLLSLYVAAIVPGEYNNPLPFYFPFLPSFWRDFFQTNRSPTSHPLPPTTETSSLLHQSPSTDTAAAGAALGNFFEPSSETEHKNIAIRLSNLVKIFGSTPAVDNLSLDLPFRTCFGILGHNGSGKSTTINMITSIYPPDQGSITFYDKSTHEPISPTQTAGLIGICPQYNSLYPELSMRQHMLLISRIKLAALGQERSDIQIYQEITDIADRLKLGPSFDNLLDAPILTLSGGSKRKVCLAMALLHSPDILVLDEPTSGCDIQVQQEIWQIIHRERDRGSLVLLTTHNLEEASISNRIAILLKGNVMCNGSPTFLKESCGLGYNISLSKIRKEHFDRIATIDQSQNQGKTIAFGGNHLGAVTTSSGQYILQRANQLVADSFRTNDKCEVPELKLHSDTQHDIVLTIALSHVDAIPRILDILDGNKEALGIVDVNLGLTDLSDVFLLCNSGQMESSSYLAPPSSDFNSIQTSIDDLSAPSDGASSLSSSSSPTADGLRADEMDIRFHSDAWNTQRQHMPFILLFFLQIIVLWRKRFIILYRELDFTIKLFFVPFMCFFILALLQLNTLIEDPVLTSYNALASNMPTMYSTMTAPTSSNIDVSPANAFSKTFSNPSSSHWQSQAIDTSDYSFEQTSGTTVAHYDEIPWQIAINSTAWQSFSASSPMYLAAYFTTTQAVSPASTQRNGILPEGIISINTTTPLSALLGVNRFYASAGEYLSWPSGSIINVKSYSQPFPNYWMPLLASTLFAFCLALTICTLVPALVYLQVFERTNKIFHLQRISGMSTIAYWVATIFFDMSIIVAMVAFMHLGAHLIGVSFGSTSSDLYEFFLFYFAATCAILPWSYIMGWYFKDAGHAKSMILYTLLFGPVVLEFFWLVMISMAFSFFSTSFMSKLPFIVYWYPLFIIPSAWFIPPSIVYMFGKYVSIGHLANWTSILWLLPIYWVVMIFLQLCDNYHLSYTTFFQGGIPIQHPFLTPDRSVIDTHQTIASGNWRNDPPESHPLVSSGLRKTFGQFTAVNNLFFEIKPNTVFSLLGANGAGKSTTISMLSAELTPSSSSPAPPSPHTAYILANSITAASQSCWNHIGLCPQQDAISLSLTARETLVFYSHLRGVTGALCTTFVNDLLNVLGLEYAADRPASGYSLGMRRRLSVGVALVGNPEVVLLDEPSTGVDPISRRNLALLLKSTCKHRAVLLTSHNMDDIEALSDDVGIMAHGQMQIIGSKGYLKQSLGDKYCVTLSVTPGYETIMAYYILAALSKVPILPEVQGIIADLDRKRIEHQTQTGQALATTLQGDSAPIDTNYSDADAAHAAYINSLNVTAEEAHQMQQSVYIFPPFSSACTMAGVDLYLLRHGTLKIHVRKTLFSISQLFLATKQFQNDHSDAILTYNCAHMPLDQVFLESMKRADGAYFGGQPY